MGKKIPYYIFLRGQITAEALMLVALMLGLLIISASTGARLVELNSDMLAKRAALTELDIISHYNEEICTLGPGNSRMMQLNPRLLREFISDPAQKTLSIRGKDWEVKKSVLCPMRVENPKGFSSEAYLWYEKGVFGQGPTVVLSPKPYGK